MGKTETISYRKWRGSYKFGIVAFAMYLLFFSHAFISRAEAPERIQEDGLPLLTAKDFTVKELEEIERRKREEMERRIHRERVEKVRKYFARYNLPLAKEAELFVKSAEKYGIDWRLLPAISFIESTGGKFSCGEKTHNAFGWHSCRKSFSSYEESIDFITKNLAGKYPGTARYYRGKDIRGILEAYNPPSIVPDYADKVMRQMDIIDSMKIENIKS